MSTGNFLGEFVTRRSGGLRGPSGLAFGPDGHLYVAQQGSNDFGAKILSYDGTTGAFRGVYTNFRDATDGIQLVRGLKFGPDGNLYIFDDIGPKRTRKVFRFQGPVRGRGDPAPGTFIDEYSTVADWLRPDRRLVSKGMVFGPDDNLYLVDQQLHATLYVQGPHGPDPGACIDTFASSGGDGPGCAVVSPGLGHLGGLRVGSTPKGMAFDANGDMYLTTGQAYTGPEERILHYDSSGNFVDEFVSNGVISEGWDLTFGPDGNLYVADRDRVGARGRILVFGDPHGAKAGQLLHVFTPPPNMPFVPRYLTFGPDELLVSAREPAMALAAPARVPLPSTAWLLMVGLLGVALLQRKRSTV
jgi:DNA-binding beta-propeller fold protein YncE